MEEIEDSSGNIHGSPLPAIWELDSPEYECDCPGPPPPIFKLPPPPRPPFFPEISDCSDMAQDTCDPLNVIDAEFHSNPAFPTVTIIVISSALLLLGALIILILAWRHKRKMQNFLPCKSASHNRRDLTHGTGMIYEDLTNVRARPMTQPSIEMLDVKAHNNFQMIGHPGVFICSTAKQDHYCQTPRQQHRFRSQDLYNPVYEELSNRSIERGESEEESECIQETGISEDEFAEDELSVGDHYHLPDIRQHSGTSSLQGFTGNDLCRDIDSSDADDRSRFLSHKGPSYIRSHNDRNFSLPSGRRNRQSKYPHKNQNSIQEQKRPRSLERRRGSRKCKNPNEFHEGFLLDSLYQVYPNGPDQGNVRLPYILPVNEDGGPSVVNPYESVPVLSHLRNQQHQYYPQNRNENFPSSFRPIGKPVNINDSDSGYSNNTSGGRGSNSSRSRSETLHRLSDQNS